MLGSIYIIKNTVNNKVYIGQTIKPIGIRFTNHKMASRLEDTKFYRAIRKYGEDKFYIELLEQVDTNKLNEREQYWINYYDSYRNGYNSTYGGDGARTTDYEKIIQLWDKGYTISKIASCLDVDTRAVSEALKGSFNISSEEIKKRAEKLSHKLTDEFILQKWEEGLTPNQIYERYGSTSKTIKKVLRENNITDEMVKDRVDQNQRNCSYEEIQKLWSSGKSMREIMRISHSNMETIRKQLFKIGVTPEEIQKRRYQHTCQTKKPVAKKDFENNIIATYESAVEASRQNNIPSFGIRDCCNGKRKDYKGYIWEWS